MRNAAIVVCLVTLAVSLGCEKQPVESSDRPITRDRAEVQPPPAANVVAEAEGFAIPESVCPAGDGTVFISNIDAAKDKYWDDDGKGYISRADAKTLEILEERWADGFNGPKGMCIFGDQLWVADNARIIAVSLADPAQREVFEPEDAGQINDLATDGEIIYASDTTKSKIHRIKGSELIDPIPAPKGVNGITFDESQMWAVSWDLHEIYRIDPTGTEPPEAIGTAEHFESLDGIEVLPDGALVVSDFPGNKVCTVDPEALTVTTIAELPSPADIGLDREAGILYVPTFDANKVVAIQLP